MSYGTTTAVLVQANCLANANRIFTGQQLRVPPGGSPPPAGERTVTTRASYLKFENGYMIWRNDTGTVYVLYRSVGQPPAPGKASASRSIRAGQTHRRPPNSSLVLPINAFGKVWVSGLGVRGSLGWAVRNEVSHKLFVYSIQTLQLLYVSWYCRL
jgi:hypothetical protein